MTESPRFVQTKRIDAYWSVYADQLAAAAKGVDPAALHAAADLMTETIKADGWIYACGNGGSAAIANHLHCDFTKGVATDTPYRPRIISLSANIETITAIGNDISYADIFAYQLKQAGRVGDLLVTVSSSGDSENIVRAIEAAKAQGMRCVALTGFAGGRSRTMADVSIHVPAGNYGVVEDLHQSMMHVLAQFIRQAAMPAETFERAKF
ncbi:MAG: SIS domain-containing protein [Elsteraceae bacterium]